VCFKSSVAGTVLGGAGSLTGGYFVLRGGSGPAGAAGCCLMVVSIPAVLYDIGTVWSTASGVVLPISHLQDFNECQAAGVDPPEACDPMR
jgi:hypothetical protein